MKVPVVDNGGQWTHREWRVLRDLGAESEIVPNTRDLRELDPDGVVLSGGALSVEASDAPLGVLDQWVDRIGVPVLGICVGHQFLARHYEGTVTRNTGPAFGRVEITVDDLSHPLFAGLPAQQRVWESHNDSVTRLPEGWKRVAHSAECPVEAMAHPTKPVFGVQFHPEVEHSEHGRAIFERFLGLCRR